MGRLHTQTAHKVTDDGSGATVTETIECDFVAVKQEAVRKHPIKTSGTAIQIEHTIATMAVKVMVVRACNYRKFISIRLAGHAHCCDDLVFKQAFDDSVYGSYADAW